MQTTNKTTSVKKYNVVSDSFIGPLMPNQKRESEIEIKKFNYEEIDYSQLSEMQTEEEMVEFYRASEYIKKSADANNDGIVDEVDLSIYERFETDPGLGAVVDLTGDGKINLEDASLLEKYLSGAPNLSSYLSEYTLLEYEKVVEKEQYESALSELNRKISSLDEELSKYDYNKDGVVDDKDLEYIGYNYDMNKSLSLKDKFSDPLLNSQKTGGNFDINSDGIVDIKDADELKNKIQELSDLKSSVILIESFIPSIESEIEKYAYYKTLVSNDFEDFTLNYSNSTYKDLCDYLQSRGSNDVALNEYINNLISYVNSSEYSEEEFQKKYSGFEPIFNENGYCEGMYFDGLAVVEYLKENYDTVANLEYVNSLSDYNKFYKYMTEDQKRIYHYLFSTKGKEEANKFANSINDDINKAAGYEKAMEFINTLEFDENGNLSEDSFAKVRNTLRSGSRGTATGMEDYIVGLVNAIYDTASEESSYTEWDYQKMYTAALLTQLSSDGAEELAYEFGQVYGNMIIPILLSEIATMGLATSFLPAAATTTIGKGISFASIMPSSYGNSLHEYQASGYDSSSARACALMVSLSDSAAEVVFGSVLGKGSGNVLIDVLNEGIEEAGASSLQMGFESAILGKEITIDDASVEIGKSFLFGALMSGMMSGKSTITANMYSDTFNIDCQSALEYITENPNATVEDVIRNATAYMDVKFEIDSETGTVVENSYSFYHEQLTVEESILEVIKRHDAKYGVGDALKRLNQFIDPNHKNYANYNLITSSDNARNFLTGYNPSQIEHALNNLCYTSDLRNISGIFTKFGNSKYSNYGANQGGIESLCVYKYNGYNYTYRQAMKLYNDAIVNGTPIPHFKKKGTIEYFKLRNKLEKQGFSEADASIIMSTVNDAGACSYASVVNEIYASFVNKEVEFEQKFGYPMYKLENGQKVFNSNELLLDLYVYSNQIKNGGNFINDDNTLNQSYLKTDRYDVFERRLLDAKAQRCMSYYYNNGTNNGTKDITIKNFLKAKGVDYTWGVLKSNTIGEIIDDSTFNDVIVQAQNQINSGNVLTIDIFSSGNVINMNSSNPNLYPSTSTNTWNEGGGHSMFVTGIGSDCFYVSSWGREYSIPFSNLKNGGKFNLFLSRIE